MTVRKENLQGDLSQGKPESAIWIKGASFSRGADLAGGTVVPTLEDISLEVPAGSLVVVLGKVHPTFHSSHFPPLFSPFTPLISS